MRRLRKNTGIALLYLFILVLTVPVLYLLPDTGGWAKGVYYERDAKMEELLSNQYRDPMAGIEFGAQGDRDSCYKISEQSFKISGNHLDFQVIIGLNDGDSYRRILIQRKTVDDGKIGVAVYAGFHYFDHLNFTERVTPPDVQLRGNVLNVTDEGRGLIHLTLKRMSEDFTQSQFQPEVRFGMSQRFDLGVIYVEVPKSMEVGQDLNNYAQVSENP